MKEYPDKITAGIAYYTFISVINGIKLTTRELQLLSFINYRGTISSSSARLEFCSMFSSSEATIANMTSKLVSLKLLIKDKNKTKINPTIRIDFENDLMIRFLLRANKEEEYADKS